MDFNTNLHFEAFKIPSMNTRPSLNIGNGHSAPYNEGEKPVISQSKLPDNKAAALSQLPAYNNQADQAGEPLGTDASLDRTPSSMAKSFAFWLSSTSKRG